MASPSLASGWATTVPRLRRWILNSAECDLQKTGTPLRYAPAYGSEEKTFCLLTRHLSLSAQARLTNVPGYYQPSR
jgi:hypothetical protein